MKRIGSSRIASLFICAVLASPFLNSCGAADSQDSASSTSTTELAKFKPEWSVYAPQMVIPGKKISLEIYSTFTASQDVLVDMLDAKGWYVGTRITVKAGEQSNQVTLTLPATVKDPASVYIAFKVLQIGASWEKYLDQKIVPLQWSVATPIAKKLYFGSTLSSWNYPFLSPVGNHGSSTVEVGLAADKDPKHIGPFQGSYAIQSFSSNYGLFDTYYGLNLETGEVYTTSLDASITPFSRVTKVYKAPANAAEMKNYIEVLNSLIEAVRFNSTFQQGVEWPQLKGAAKYLGRVSASLYGSFGETLQATFQGTDVTHLYIGEKNYIAVKYGAASARDLLFDLSVGGKVVAGIRVPVEQGTGDALPVFNVPSSVKPLSKGIVSVKIVPTGESATSKTAEVNIPVLVLGPNHISYVDTTDFESVTAGTAVKITGAYTGTEILDVRSDLIDANGKWLAGAVGHATLSSPGVKGFYNFNLSFNVPANLLKGAKVTLYTKLLPIGADWTQALDDSPLLLTVK